MNWIKLALYAAVFAAGFAFAWLLQDGKIATIHGKHATVMADIAEKTRVAAEKARNVEREWDAMLDAIATTHQQELRDAQTLYDDTVAGLRAGSIRMQDRWTCPAANVPGVVARSREPDGAANDRAESASRILRAAAECDSQVRGLQAVTQADRHPGPQP